jgi:hypothetical protein
MQFLDKLEELLLNPDLHLNCMVRTFNEQKVLGLTVYPVSKKENSKVFKTKAIKSMISYLKRPERYKNKKYYSLSFLSEKFQRANIVWQKILELNPTEDELIHLYQHTAYRFNFNMLNFINELNTKESMIRLIKLGYDGEGQKKPVYENLREVLCVLSWNKEKPSDEENMDAISGYIKNSNKITETNKEIIDICNVVIKDQQKFVNFIKELIGEDIPLRNKIEKHVLKLEIHPFSIISEQRVHSYNLHEHLKNFEKHIIKNLDLITDILSLNYYQNNIPESDGYYMHNFIIESKSQNTNEVIELLKLYTDCLFEYYNIEPNGTFEDFYKYLDKNPSLFSNLVLKRNLEKNCIINQENKKKNPVKV